MRFTRNIAEGNMYKSFLLYAVPLIISSLLTQAYSTIDAVIAGKFIGEYALGAISATGSYEQLFRSLFNGFSAGFGIYIAQQFGRGAFAAVKRDSVSMGIIVAAFSFFVSILSVFFRNPIMDYLKVDPVLRGEAESYFVIYSMGYALPNLNLLLIQTLYALGCTSFSLYVSFIAAVFKTGGNLLSVLVLDLGVEGLAIFSVLSNGAATACYLVLLRKAFKELKCEKDACRARFSGIWGSMKYCLPVAIQQMIFNGVSILIAPSINGLGAAATTAYNVSSRIYNFGTLTLWRITNAFTCCTAQCIGMGDQKKIHESLKVGFILSCLMMLPFVLAPVIFAEQTAAIFFPDGYIGDAYEYTVRYVAFYLPFIYVQLVGHILHAYMRCLSAVNIVLGITVLCSAIRVVSTILLVPAMHIEGAYLGQIVSWAVDAVISIIIVLCLFRTQDQLKNLVERVRKNTPAKA